MSNYFGTGLDQAPLNEQLGEAAYWDLRQLYDIFNSPPKVVVAAYTARNWETIGIDTSISSFTISLPTNPEINDRIRFFDPTAMWEINNPIITAGGEKIMGAQDDLYLNIKGGNFTLAYSGDDRGWVIV